MKTVRLARAARLGLWVLAVLVVVMSYIVTAPPRGAAATM